MAEVFRYQSTFEQATTSTNSHRKLTPNISEEESHPFIPKMNLSYIARNNGNYISLKFKTELNNHSNTKVKDAKLYIYIENFDGPHRMHPYGLSGDHVNQDIAAIIYSVDTNSLQGQVLSKTFEVQILMHNFESTKSCFNKFVNLLQVHPGANLELVEPMPPALPFFRFKSVLMYQLDNVPGDLDWRKVEAASEAYLMPEAAPDEQPLPPSKQQRRERKIDFNFDLDFDGFE